MTRCPICPNQNNCVGGDGPFSSKILFVGEAPGGNEDRYKRVFIGPTGEELNKNYLPLAGLDRSSVRIANAISCLPPGPKGKLDPKKRAHLELLESCSQHHLIPEIKCNSYSLIIPMGNFACKVIDPTIDLELDHGIPRITQYGWAFPMYHPAGGLHEPKKMLQIRTDWVRLRKYLNGKLRTPRDEYAGAEDYRLLDDPYELNEILYDAYDQPLACDTEITRKGHPFCMTFSCKAGTGYMIRASSTHILEHFQKFLDKWEGPILFHNWLFDEKVVENMALRFPKRKIIDTMVESFHLGNLPQGLKALAYRELGMKMQDFYDLVSPYSTQKVIAYYHEMLIRDWPKPEPQIVRADDGFYKEYKPQGLNTKLKRFFTDYGKDPEKDVFKTWDNWEESHRMIEMMMEEEWPGLCITHAPLEKVIHYACRDSDATFRLYPIIKKMQSQVRKTSQEHWNE